MSERNVKKPLEQLLNVAKAVAHGDFSKEAEVDATGVIAQLAGELNNTVRNLRSATPTFTETTDQTPLLADTAQSIIELMANSTRTTLDSADDIVGASEVIEDFATNTKSNSTYDAIMKIKERAFDIIAAQSYQDSARQKLEALEKELEKIRNSMLEALIIMKLRTGKDAASLRNKQRMMQEVKEGKNEEKKQDLVDQLLAEFGL